MPNLNEQYEFDVFVSYSHEDGWIADEIHKGLRHFVRPFYRRSALRVFRDSGRLQPGEPLWHSIEQALVGSEFLLLVATPNSARSPNVRREVEFWANLKRPASHLLVVAAGATKFEWETSDVVPDVVRDLFSEEPFTPSIPADPSGGPLVWSEPPMDDLIRRLGARIRGVDPEDLDDSARRVTRVNRLVAGGIAALILALFVAGLQVYRSGAALEGETERAALEQRRADEQALRADEQALRAEEESQRAAEQERIASEEEAKAEAETREALSRRLSAESDLHIETDPVLAMQLASAAHAASPSREARRAVRAAADPSLVLAAQPSDRIIDGLAFSPDGTAVAIGGAFNTLVEWRLDGAELQRTDLTTACLPGESCRWISDLVYEGDDILFRSMTIGQDDFPELSDFVLRYDRASGQVDIEGEAPWPSDDDASSAGQEWVAERIDLDRLDVRSLVSDTAFEIAEEDDGYIQEFVVHPDRPYLFSFHYSLPRDVADLRVWHLGERREVERKVIDRKGVATIALSPDGLHLAAGLIDGGVQVWNVDRLVQPRELRRQLIEEVDLSGLSGMGVFPEARLALAGDGGELIFASGYGSALYEIGAGIEDKGGLPTEGLYAWPRPDRVLLVGADGYIASFASDTAETVLEGEVDLWDPVATATVDGQIAIVETRSVSLYDSAPFVNGEQMSGEGGDGATDGTLQEIEVTETLWPSEGDEHLTRLTSAAFSPDGQRLAAGSEGGGVHIWDLAAPQGSEGRREAQLPILYQTIMTNGHAITAVEFDPSGRFFATALSTGLVEIFDATTFDLLARQTASDFELPVIEFIAGGDVLAVGRGPSVQLLDTASGAPLGSIVAAGVSSSVLDLSAPEDGSILVGLFASSDVVVWRGGDISAADSSLEAICASIAPLSPDAYDFLAQAEVREVAAGLAICAAAPPSSTTDVTEPLAPQLSDSGTTNDVVYTGHQRPVSEIVQLPSGLIASGDLRGAIHIWDPDAPETPIDRIDAHRGSIRALAVLPNGDLVSGSAGLLGESSDIAVWSIDGGEATERSRLPVGWEDNGVLDLGTTVEGHIIATYASTRVEEWIPTGQGYDATELRDEGWSSVYLSGIPVGHGKTPDGKSFVADAAGSLHILENSTWLESHELLSALAVAAASSDGTGMLFVASPSNLAVFSLSDLNTGPIDFQPLEWPLLDLTAHTGSSAYFIDERGEVGSWHRSGSQRDEQFKCGAESTCISIEALDDGRVAIASSDNSIFVTGVL